MFSFLKNKDTKGINLLRIGRLDAALEYYSARHASDPKNAEIIVQIAKIHFRKNEYAKTKDWLRNARGLKLNDFDMTQILDMTNFRKLAEPDYFNSNPVFSPDGKWIAFTSARKDTNGDGKINLQDRPGLYMVNIETGSEIQIASSEFYNNHPAFSPDGEKIVYLSTREDTVRDGTITHADNPGLYMIDLSTGKEECLVQASDRPKFPSFSPDGEHLLFCGWANRSRYCGVYIMDMKTRVIRSLNSASESNYPVFSPKGDRIIFSNWSRDTNKDGVIDLRDNSALIEVDPKSRLPKLLVSDEFSNSYPCFSPDGGSIAYLSCRRDTNKDGVINSLDNSGIYVRNLENGTERMLVADDHYNKFPAFSHDGRRLVFIGSWRGRKPKDDDLESTDYFDTKGIHCIDLDGTNEVEVVSTKYYGSRFLSVSPKANLVAYISWRKDTNRGLYLAPFDRQPTQSELANFIENNL